MTVQTLGRYQIISELGRGAMGTVYHGMDMTIERPVAIKTLNPDLPDDIQEEIKQRFLREAKSAGRLNHPNIVTIYEFGESNGIAFIAMEYLEGKSLLEVVRGSERLPYATIASMIAQIADGLDYAHRFGIVHRDIKPANIMVSAHGVAKLTDFGIAHLQSSTMTQAGAMLGSPKYMAPEYVLGKQIDGRADIFSLGIVLYELLTRRTPFEEGDSSTIFSMMQRIVNDPQRPLSQMAPDAPPAFDVILARALAKNPDQRYQRAGQFANDLHHYKTLPVSGEAQAQGEATTVVNRAAYRDAVASMPQVTPPAAASSPATPSSPATLSSPATPAGAARPAPAPAAAAAPAAGQSAWQRAAAFLNRGAEAPAAPPPAPPAPPAVTPPASPPVSRFAATQPPAPAAPAKNLLGDLDNLGEDIDRAQRKFIEEEKQAMEVLRRGAPRAKDWNQLQDNLALTPGNEHIAPPPPSSSVGSATDPTGQRKSSVFGLLRQQASADLKSQATAKRDAEAEAMLSLDAKVREGYQFLLEVCRELNETAPIFAGKHELLFYGPCPALFFKEATVNARMNRIDDRGKIKDIIDHLLLSYYLQSADQGKAMLTAVEFPTFIQLLDSHEVKYHANETKNDFGKTIRANVEFEFKFICSLTLRVNYAEGNIDLTGRNIGPLGRSRYIVPTARVDMAFFEELSKLMLGFPCDLTRYAVVG